MLLRTKGIKWGTGTNDVNSRSMPAHYTPTNYTPAQVDAEGSDKVSSHLKGIDTKLGASAISKYSNDLTFNGTDTQKDEDVSSTISDARNAIVQLLDAANNYERIHCEITATSISNIRINTTPALPAGTYRLVVLG